MQVSWSWNQKSSRGYQLFMQKYATSVWWIKMFKIKPRKLFSLSLPLSLRASHDSWPCRERTKFFAIFKISSLELEGVHSWKYLNLREWIFLSEFRNKLIIIFFFFFFVTRKINRKFQNILESVTRLDFTFFFNNFIDYHMINYTRHKKSIRSLKRSRERTTTLE